MDQQIKEDFQAAYYPPNIEILVNEWADGAEIGEPCRVEALSKIFSWKRGFINCFTGWGNDGKTTFFLYLTLLQAHFDKKKICLWSPEMMSSHKTSTGVKMTANDIYNDLVWMMTGKTPYKHIAKRYNVQQIELKEYTNAIDFIEQHFFVVHPKDRTHSGIIRAFRWYYEKYGISIFLADPFKAFKMMDDNRADLMLNEYFMEAKDFAIETHSTFNYIAHPKNIVDVREKGQGGLPGAYKLCTQYMLAGGQAWDNNMDGIYSIYRPERHLNPTDPKVHFYNLKQRKEDLVGDRGVFEKIVLDRVLRRYFFDDICPLSGEKRESGKFGWKQAVVDFSEAKPTPESDDVPF